MFYYRITTSIKTTEKGKRPHSVQSREYAHLGDLGDYVVALLARRDVLGVNVTKINQRDFVAATRPGE